MGQNISLYVDDESIESPYISRKFKDEIIFEGYIKFSDFLSKDESAIVAPNSYGEIVLGKKRDATFLEKAKLPIIMYKALQGTITVDEINKMRDELVVRSQKVNDRERNPESLKNALKRVEKYLTDKSSELPLVHFVYTDSELKDEIGYVQIEGIKAHLEGDLFFYDNYDNVKNKIHVKSYNEDYGKVDFFVEVKPEVEIANKRYFTKSITKAEEFKDEFKKCYDFLDSAIKAGKSVLWEFG
ncbi:MAG: hypothetical protein V4538_08065 [Bacteroidota bacterium]